MKYFVILFLIASGGLLIPQANALLESMSLDDLAERSKFVMIGKVIEVTPLISDIQVLFSGNIERLLYDVVLQVEEDLDGKYKYETITFRVWQTRVVGSMTYDVEDAQSFEAGERVLVFLAEKEPESVMGDAYTVQGTTQGKYLLVDGIAYGTNQLNGISEEELVSKTQKIRNLILPQTFASEPAMNLAPLLDFGYYDDHGDKVHELIAGEEYFIKAQFYWPESYFQPYEFIVEIHDDKKHRVIERFSVAGDLVPNKEMSVYFSWVPKEPGEFRNYSELRNSDESTVLTGVPQYDFQVLEPTDEYTYGPICRAGIVLVDGICVNPNPEYFDTGLKQILLFVSIGVIVSVVSFVIIWKKRK